MVSLSIIVPVYNVEKYLDECLQSIIVQITNDDEVILIDDGSKDDSGRLCDLWASKNDQIIVIHKENGGLSSARNEGLKIAKQEYVLFIDSDDKIDAGSIKELKECISESKADYYFLSGMKFYPDGKTVLLDAPIDRKLILGKSSCEVIESISLMTRYPGSACTKAYKRAFLVKYNLMFPADRRIAEDLGFTLRCLLAAENFDVCNSPFYLYRQNRAGSITSLTTGAEKSFWNLLTFINESVDLLTTNRMPNGDKERFVLRFVAYEYSVALLHYCKLKDNVIAAYHELKGLKWLKKFYVSRRGRIISFLLSVFGIRITSRILSFAYLNRERKCNG